MSRNDEKSGEKFVSRWSRLKQEAKEPPAVKERLSALSTDAGESAPELPPLDKLGIDSDYRIFFHPKVSENLRRAALKRLFSNAHFNVMDGLDVYIEDYSKAVPIPAAVLAQLTQAKKIIDWAREGSETAADKCTEQSNGDIPRPVAVPPASLEPPSSLPVPDQMQGNGESVASHPAQRRDAKK